MNKKVGTKIAIVIAAGATLLTFQRAHSEEAAPQTKETNQLTSKPMRIGVIGAGSLGGTVGSVLVKAGHEVKFSSRHPDELTAMARELGPRASVGTPREAAEFGTVLLFAVPYEALPELGRDLKDAIRGKIVLDACNAWGNTPIEKEAVANGNGPTSVKLLPGTRLVRAFSAIDATQIAASFKRQKEKLAVPLASDDADAMQVAAQLVRDAGCDPVIVGDLASGRKFERGTPGFRAHLTADKLRQLLGLPQ
ncbi:MAG TPA: NADPH-dependent F420 reductase [Chthoniobacterales bacterium]|nr:NADPH-dependent F420 reductase [Chthoniobacterales bacterium]